MPAKQPKALTAKQQQMLEHIQRAKQQGQSLSNYAHQHGVKLKALYNYHWLLRQKGLLAASDKTPPFVKIAKPKRPVHTTNMTVTIYFPNGIHVDLHAHDTALSMLLHQVQSL